MGKWILASAVVLIHALAQWAASPFAFNSKAPLAVASVATGILVFVWLLSWGGWPGDDQMPKEARLRAAIAGGIVAQYLSLVAIVAFFRGEAEGMQDITQAFVTSFTAVVTVVIAFYFSASAYVEGMRVKRDDTASDDV